MKAKTTTTVTRTPNPFELLICLKMSPEVYIVLFFYNDENIYNQESAVNIPLNQLSKNRGKIKEREE